MIKEGSVYFRQTQNSTLLQQAASDVERRFRGRLEVKTFIPTVLMVVTWYNTGYEALQVAVSIYHMWNSSFAYNAMLSIRLINM